MSLPETAHSNICIQQTGSTTSELYYIIQKKWHIFDKEAEQFQMTKNLNSLIHGLSDVPRLLEPMSIRQYGSYPDYHRALLPKPLTAHLPIQMTHTGFSKGVSVSLVI